MAEDKPINYNLPSNTDKEKLEAEEERESLPQLVDAPATRRKKTVGRKFKEALTGEDAKSAFSYTFMDVVVPAVKGMFLDAVNETLSRMLYGDVRGRARPIIGGGMSTNNYVPYNRISTPAPPGGGGNPVNRAISQKARATHDFDEIVLGSRGEAQLVLDGLLSRIGNYQVATVSDLYDFVGITGSFTDNNWGWTDLTGSTIDRAGRAGYVLTLPKPQQLN